MKRFLLTFFCILFGLYILCTPFSYRAFPTSVLEWIYDLFTGLASFSGKYLFGQTPVTSIELSSDSIWLYIHTANLCLISVVLTAVIHGLSLRKNVSLPNITTFRNIFSYYLSLQLLIYGLDKVFGNQFYFPEPNTLYTPLGQLDKDILFWSTMATSKLYLVATGLIESLGALLLWFRRTRYLGGFVALGALVQIILVNFGFNISVKLHTLLLFTGALFIVWPALKALWGLFIMQQKAAIGWPKTMFASSLELTRHVLFKALAIFFIILEAGSPHLLANDWEKDIYQNQVVGAYEVLHQQSGAYTEGFCELDPINYHTDSIQYLFFHSQEYFIVQQAGTFRDFQIEFKHGLGTNWQMAKGNLTLLPCTTPRHFIIRWYRSPHNSSTFIVRKIDLKELPISQDNFHWFMESYSH